MPVFDEGIYRGSLSILIPFDSIAADNLVPVRILSSGHAWMISQNGNILYSPVPDQIDRSAFAVFQSSPTVTALAAKAMHGEEGISSYTVENEDPEGGPVIFEVVFYPIRIGDGNWSIIVATPLGEVLGTLKTFRQDLAIIFSILVASLIFFTYYMVRARGIVREEEKRKAAEVALLESERNYRTIVENLQDIYYRTDREDNLIMVSPSGIQQMGYTNEKEILGRPVGSFFFNHEEYEGIIRSLKENGSVSNYEIRLVKADGTVLTALSNSRIYSDSEGNFLGTEGIIRDITSRKRVENVLHQATRKLSLLTAITTTNIRNAAFTLSGYLELEQLQADENKRREYHEKEVAILSQINLWLNTAKSYQDLGLNPPRWQNVNTTIIYAISHLDMTVISHSVSVEGLEIYADPLLENVFFNLAENVLLHGGSATTLTIGYEQQPEGLMLIVEDNGAGIPDAMKKNIFEHELIPAKGLGLFMAREILGITGITIRETGIYGKGARFELTIPPEGYRFTGNNA